MSYTYEQRKRPQGRENTAPERTSAPVPGFNALMPGTSAPQNGPSFDLAGAMQARMASTFGDLSAVRSYTPLVQTHAPVQTGPYTGPVTHALSNAGPSPAVAGPMQAFRDGDKEPEPEKVKPPKLTKAQKLAKKNADRMYKIQHGLLLEAALQERKENKKNRVVSQKDRDWFDQFNWTGSNLTPELNEELMSRKASAANKLVDFRNRIGQKNPGRGERPGCGSQYEHCRERL